MKANAIWFLHTAVRTALIVALLPPLAGARVDPAIDIRSPADVTAKRAALVQFIWGTTWSAVLSFRTTSTST